MRMQFIVLAGGSNILVLHTKARLTPLQGLIIRQILDQIDGIAKTLSGRDLGSQYAVFAIIKNGAAQWDEIVDNIFQTFSPQSCPN